MSLSNALRNSISYVLSFASFFKLIPYEWDPKAFRLREASLKNLYFHMLHFWVTVIMLAYSTIRLLSTLHHDIPERLRIMNLLWCGAYVLLLICLVQFRLRMNEIRLFTNWVFSHVHQLQEFAEIPSSKWEKYISIHVLIYLYVITINPPFHSIMVLDSPCAPHFTSSLFFPCRNYLDNALNSDDVSFWKNLFFFPIEFYFVVLMFFVWGFNFIVVVHAMVWLKSEMEQLRRVDYDRSIRNKYRHLQYYVNYFNDAFKLYMEWYPLILISIVALLIFGMIRYWGEDWRAYTMFPACGVRCFLEVATPTALAGSSNNKARSFLKEMKRKFQLKNKFNEETKCFDGYNKHWMKAFQKSCPILAVRAGSLYEMENTIVLTYLDNCCQMTLDLLLFSGNRGGSIVQRFV